MYFFLNCFTGLKNDVAKSVTCPYSGINVRMFNVHFNDPDIVLCLVAVGNRKKKIFWVTKQKTNCVPASHFRF